ncbi:lipoprotein 17-related variable surface protein [Mycoplasma sp. ATU-Cv-508]|uniref:lipoprotein 17-related variable surface protein n=1 Tax=Mycoplasma sp. ATU-Cv-508 TaxID=2048001 RepID=UPI000FDE566D
MRVKLNDVKTLELESKNFLPSAFKNVDEHLLAQIKKAIGFDKTPEGISLRAKIVNADDKSGKLTINFWILTKGQSTENRQPDHSITIDELLSLEDIKLKDQIQARLTDLIPSIQKALLPESLGKASESAEGIKSYLESFISQMFNTPKEMSIKVEVSHDDENNKIEITFKLMRHGEFWIEIGKTTITDFGQLQKLEKIAQALKEKITGVKTLELEDKNVLPSDFESIDTNWLKQIKKAIDFDKTPEGISLRAKIVNADDKSGKLTINFWILTKGQSTENRQPDHSITIDELLSLEDIKLKDQIQARLTDLIPSIQKALLPESLGKASESAEGIKSYLESFISQMFNTPKEMSIKVEVSHDDENNKIEITFKLMRHGEFWIEIGKTTITDFGQLQKLEKIAQALKEKITGVKTLELEDKNVLPSDFESIDTNWLKQIKKAIDFDKTPEGISLRAKIVNADDKSGKLTINFWILTKGQSTENRQPDHSITIDELLSLEDIKLKDQIQARLTDLIPSIQKALLPESLGKASESAEGIKSYLESFISQMFNTPKEMSIKVEVSHDDENNKIEITFKLMRHGEFWIEIGKTTITDFGQLQKLEKIAQALKEKITGVKTLELEDKNVLPSDFESIDTNWLKQIKKAIDFDKTPEGISLRAKIVNADDKSGKLTINFWILTKGQSTENRQPDHSITIDELLSLEDIKLKDQIQARLTDLIPSIQKALLPESLGKAKASEFVKLIHEYFENALNQLLDITLPDNFKLAIESQANDETSQIEFNFKLLRNDQNWLTLHKTLIKNFDKLTRLEEYAEKIRQKLSSLKTLELEEKSILPSNFKNPENLATLIHLIKNNVGWDEKISDLEMFVDVIENNDEVGTITMIVWVFHEHIGKSKSVGFSHVLSIDGLLKTSDLETHWKNTREARKKLSDVETTVEIKHKNFLPSEIGGLDKETIEKLKKTLGFKGTNLDPE